jgi:hypothetical protein
MKSPEFPQACNTRTNPTTNNSAATTAPGQDNLGEERTDTQDNQDTIKTLKERISRLECESLFLQRCVEELETNFQMEIHRLRTGERIEGVVN